MKKRWLLRATSSNYSETAKKLGISETLAIILDHRGLTEANEIKYFFHGGYKDLYDPFLMKDMDRAIDILLEAINEEKKIVIYGDYDVDGVTSAAILYRAITEAFGNVDYYIPDRENEGYGMNSERIKKLHGDGVQLIITCDNGISAIEQIKIAKDYGMEVIVTDHHEPSFIVDAEGEKKYLLPEADAIINTKQEDCSYPFKLLCGAGIAFKFVQALFGELGIEDEYLYKYIELAGIGTICDVVDLTSENRIITKLALESMNNSNYVGITALKECLGLNGKKIDVYNVGFMLGPCINATGRLEKADLAMELLLCEDKKEADILAGRLVEINKKRQEITAKNVEEALELVEKQKLYNNKVLVVYKEDFNESILGLIASKVKDKYNLPTIVLTKGLIDVKGSGRSIEGYDMFQELLKCKAFLNKFGGHPMAAGLSMDKEKIDGFINELNKNCTLSQEDIMPIIRIDKTIDFRSITLENIFELSVLEPYGKGNTNPYFAKKKALIKNINFFGKDSSVVKISIDNGDKGGIIEAICFGRAEEFKQMDKTNLLLDLIFTLNINEYMGTKKVQLKIIDFRISS